MVDDAIDIEEGYSAHINIVRNSEILETKIYEGPKRIIIRKPEWMRREEYIIWGGPKESIPDGYKVLENVIILEDVEDANQGT